MCLPSFCRPDLSSEQLDQDLPAPNVPVVGGGQGGGWYVARLRSVWAASGVLTLACPRHHTPTLSWLTADQYKCGRAQGPTGKRVTCRSLRKPRRALACLDEARPEAEESSLAGHRLGGLVQVEEPPGCTGPPFHRCGASRTYADSPWTPSITDSCTRAAATWSSTHTRRWPRPVPPVPVAGVPA